MTDISLILEGGGMRGAFTAGVLDFFLEHDLLFSDVYGVSAGACQACSYLSGQKGRGLRVWVNYLRDARFCSLSSLIRTGDLFNAAFNYDLLPNRFDPIDYSAFQQRSPSFVCVVTNVRTGQAEYIPIPDLQKGLAVVQASASLPLISNMVSINGQKYLDGGVADPIPLARSMADGHTRHVLILTQPESYRKSPNKALPLIRLKYAAYPAFIQIMQSRHLLYNRTLEEIAKAERNGTVFVIRPEITPDVRRIERNPRKLEALYRHGQQVAQARYDALKQFLYK